MSISICKYILQKGSMCSNFFLSFVSSFRCFLWMNFFFTSIRMNHDRDFQICKHPQQCDFYFHPSRSTELILEKFKIHNMTLSVDSRFQNEWCLVAIRWNIQISKNIFLFFMWKIQRLCNVYDAIDWFFLFSI